MVVTVTAFIDVARTTQVCPHLIQAWPDGTENVHGESLSAHLTLESVQMNPKVKWTPWVGLCNRLLISGIHLAPATSLQVHLNTMSVECLVRWSKVTIDVLKR